MDGRIQCSLVTSGLSYNFDDKVNEELYVLHDAGYEIIDIKYQMERESDCSSYFTALIMYREK